MFDCVCDCVCGCGCCDRGDCTCGLIVLVTWMWFLCGCACDFVVFLAVVYVFVDLVVDVLVTCLCFFFDSDCGLVVLVTVDVLLVCLLCDSLDTNPIHFIDIVIITNYILWGVYFNTCSKSHPDSRAVSSQCGITNWQVGVRRKVSERWWSHERHENMRMFNLFAVNTKFQPQKNSTTDTYVFCEEGSAMSKVQ